MEVRPDIALPEDVDMAPPPPPEEAPPPPPPEEPDGLETMLAALERASELLFAKDDPEVFALELAGVDGTLEQRCVLAKCALKCALELRVAVPPPARDHRRGGRAGLVMFTERLRSALEELEESSQYQATPMCLSPRAGRRESDGTASTDCTAETAPEAVDLVVGGREGGLDDDVVWSSAFGDFVLFCGGMSCLGGGGALDADAAASPRTRGGERPEPGAAARCFQRAALHLEILRLLGGRLTAPPRRRGATRWRARHLSHLLENCVLEHGPEDPRLFEDVYEATDEVLGKGGYGVVFKVTLRADGEVFACQLELGRLSSTGMAQLHEEVNAMRALDHPHICRLREVFYSERRRCYLVLELCKGGELFDVLDRRAEPGKPAGAISERRVAQLVTMMVGCIRYMHDRGVCHRDIKLENWLFDTEDVDGGAHLKLVDFGLAKVPNGKRNEFHDRVGSAYYCAPEILGGDYDRRCDLWSLGVIARAPLRAAALGRAAKGDSTSLQPRTRWASTSSSPRPCSGAWTSTTARSTRPSTPSTPRASATSRRSVRATVGIDANKYGDDGDIDRFLEMADSDGDGKVDYAEFLDYVKRARLDGLGAAAKKLDAV
ncbi:serine/threonine kinase [Aureococcus anophagefferens]|nr:serine/threonine kinase [Aureococcus anophagefferens]